MSVITTVLGVIPLTFRGGAGSELYSGLGAAIVGGLSISTIFTLILVPVVFSLVMDITRIIRELYTRSRWSLRGNHNSM